MATSPKNRVTRDVRRASVFPDALKVLDATVSFNQGDLLVFDDTANLLAVPAAEADGETFLGIAVCTVVNGKLRGPYPGLTDVDAAEAIHPAAGPQYGVVAKLKLKVGDAFAPGDPIYLEGTDAQTVSSAGTKIIGVYQGGVVASAVAGDEGEVLLGCRYPADTLKW